MASTFSPLGVELMATGENAGTWGAKTNTNLQLVEQILGGFTQQSIAGGAGTTALTITDNGTGDTAGHRMIEFTGTISGNRIVTIPNDVQTFYILRNSTSGSHTVEFKYATGSGSSFTFASTDKGDKIVFAAGDDGTNPNILTLAIGTGISDVVDDTTPQLGGNLDVNGNNIVSTSNGAINIVPNGTGVVSIQGSMNPSVSGTGKTVAFGF
jgi:dipeptidyl aminopeptidase/acylaminoacyl peptidase